MSKTIRIEWENDDKWEIHSYADSHKILLTFSSIFRILLLKQGDYSVVEKAEPDPLNLLANTNVGTRMIQYCIF